MERMEGEDRTEEVKGVEEGIKGEVSPFDKMIDE